MKSISLAASCAAAVLAITAGGAQAATVNLKNASFENERLLNGAYIAGRIQGWNVGGNAGWQNPSASIFSSVPDGENTAWIGSQKGLYGPGSMSQVAASSVAANTRYVLNVDVGRRLEVPLAAFLVEILAGSDVVASGGFGAADIAAGAFRNLSLSYDSTTALSSPLTIRFRVTQESTGYSQVNFDNVTFDATPLAVSAVPEPATWAMMITGFGLAGGALRKRRGSYVTA